MMCRILRRSEGRHDADRQGMGYKVTLYAEDHNPPHVHVVGPDFQAKVRIVDSEVFAGAIPPRHRREALSWISANAPQEFDGEVE